MEDQMVNSSYLLQMPLLVIEEILSNVLNLSSVSRTCKSLYDIVCDMDRRKRVSISIMPVATTDDSVRLTIDDDVVFRSIMNSRRRITEIQLGSSSYHPSHVELNEQQLKRITDIMNRFGPSITSLMLRGIGLSINDIIEWLSLTPKLKTLSFANGTTSGNATKSLHLPNVKMLEIFRYTRLLDVVNLIPAGSVNYFFYYEMGNSESEMLKTVMTEQYNIKSLTLICYYDPIVLGVNHLQLDKLTLRVPYNNDQLVEILKCQTNLKELRLPDDMRCASVSVSAFEWICDNLKKLEIFEVNLDGHNPEGKNLLLMLKKLTKLRFVSTNVMGYIDDNEVQSEINSLEKLKIHDHRNFHVNFNEKVHSMARIFTNLTDLEILSKDFSQLSIVLSQCTKLIRLTSRLSSRVEKPYTQQLAGKSFPNIRQLSISIRVYLPYDFDIIVSIVRAMPNLKRLSMQRTGIIFNVDMVKEFVREKKSLEDLYVDRFKLDDNLSALEDFVNTIRCLSDNLKTYRLTFLSSNGIKDILSNEFKVDNPNDSSYFYLYKGDLTKFYD